MLRTSSPSLIERKSPKNDHADGVSLRGLKASPLTVPALVEEFDPFLRT